MTHAYGVDGMRFVDGMLWCETQNVANCYYYVFVVRLCNLCEKVLKILSILKKATHARSSNNLESVRSIVSFNGIRGQIQGMNTKVGTFFFKLF